MRVLQTSMMVLLTKIVRKFNLKTLTILAKRLILEAWLGPGRVSAYWYFAVLKIQTNMYRNTSKDGNILINYFHLMFIVQQKSRWNPLNFALRRGVEFTCYFTSEFGVESESDWSHSSNFGQTKIFGKIYNDVILSP